MVKERLMHEYKKNYLKVMVANVFRSLCRILPYYQNSMNIILNYTYNLLDSVYKLNYKCKLNTISHFFLKTEAGGNAIYKILSYE